MSRFRESRVPTQAADSNYSFAVLGYPEVGSINFTQVDSIASINYRFEQIKEESTVVTRYEALNIFKDEAIWFIGRYQFAKHAHKRISTVFLSLIRRKTKQSGPNRCPSSLIGL